MDALKYILHAVRIKPKLFQRTSLQDTWQLGMSATQGANIHFIESGHCELNIDHQSIKKLAQGDLIVISNTPDYQLQPMSPNQKTILVQGEFRAEQNIVYPIFSLLPPIIHIPNEDGQPIYWLATALRSIESEDENRRPGYEAVISRLMDVLFIMVMRSWIDQHEIGEGGWLGALYDPDIGNVLHAIHGTPGYSWTIERLAQVAMMSRSNFIERFTRMVGEPPMKYLTRWRVQLATTWIGDDNTLTLEQIAHRLGYSSSFAFSKTFKRFMGIAPNHFKQMSKIDNSDTIIMPPPH